MPQGEIQTILIYAHGDKEALKRNASIHLRGIRSCSSCSTLKSV